MNPIPLCLTVIEVVPAEGYSLVRTQASSTNPATVTCGDVLTFVVDPTVADQYAAGDVFNLTATRA